MSRAARLIAILLTCLVAVVLPAARAQTIADYSRAQRAWLESAMSQASARSAGVAASSSMPAGGVAVPSTGPSSASPPPRVVAAVPADAPAIQVSGVFKSGTGTVAEVVVNATAYLLESGQAVPGTTWRVEAVAIDRVVLGRRGASGSLDVEGARKVFALPAMR